MTIKTVSTADVIGCLNAMAEVSNSVEALSAGWWNTLAAYVHQNKVNSEDSAEQMASLLKDAVEVPWKKETGQKSMPGAYRSAKSILCGKHSALSCGLSLLNAVGDGVIGKTELEKQLADLKVDKSVADKIEALAATISTLLEKQEHSTATVELLQGLTSKALDLL